jgi:hypothetical protein
LFGFRRGSRRGQRAGAMSDNRNATQIPHGAQTAFHTRCPSTLPNSRSSRDVLRAPAAKPLSSWCRQTAKAAAPAPERRQLGAGPKCRRASLISAAGGRADVGRNLLAPPVTTCASTRGETPLEQCLIMRRPCLVRRKRRWLLRQSARPRHHQRDAALSSSSPCGQPIRARSDVVPGCGSRCRPMPLSLMRRSASERRQERGSGTTSASTAIAVRAPQITGLTSISPTTLPNSAASTENRAIVVQSASRSAAGAPR